jgi:hypothetical protein
MKKGTKVWYYKTSTPGNRVVSCAAEGVVNGVKDGKVVLTVKQQVDRNTTRDVYLHLPNYVLFKSKAELDDAVVSGVQVWTVNRGELTITEGRLDLPSNEAIVDGKKDSRFSTRHYHGTVEEAAKYLQEYVAEELKRGLHRIRESEKNLSLAVSAHKRLQEVFKRVQGRVMGKNKLLSFKPKQKTKAKAKHHDVEYEL